MDATQPKKRNKRPRYKPGDPEFADRIIKRMEAMSPEELWAMLKWRPEGVVETSMNETLAASNTQPCNDPSCVEEPEQEPAADTRTDRELLLAMRVEMFSLRQDVRELSRRLREAGVTDAPNPRRKREA